MSMTAKLLTLGVLRSGGGDPSASFTVTTTGAQTGSFQALTVSAPTRVDWGDGTPIDIYTGSGYRSHAYASAGVWTVKILDPLNVTALDLRDTKITALAGAQIAKLVNLTSLYLNNLSGLTWTVGAAAPMPTGLTTLDLFTLSGVTWTVGASAPMPTGLTYLRLNTLSGVTWTVGASAPMPTDLTSLYLHTLSGVTWTVGASAPMPTGLTTLDLNNLSGLTWTVGAAAPMPTGLTTLNLQVLSGVTWTVGASAPMPTGLTTTNLFTLSGLTAINTGLDTLTKLATFRYENNLTTAQVNAVLANLWAGFAARTVSGGTIDLLGGGNLGPTGPVAAENPPTYGGAYAYELVNDTGSVNPTRKWVSVTTATPV